MKFDIVEFVRAVNNMLREMMPPELLDEMPGNDPVVTVIGGARDALIKLEQHERRLAAHDRSTDALFQRVEDLERAVRAYIDSPKPHGNTKPVNDDSELVGTAYKVSDGFSAINYNKLIMSSLPPGEYEIYLRKKQD